MVIISGSLESCKNTLKPMSYFELLLANLTGVIATEHDLERRLKGSWQGNLGIKSIAEGWQRSHKGRGL